LFCSRSCSYSSSSRRKKIIIVFCSYFLFFFFFFFFRSRLLFSILSILIASTNTVNPAADHVSFSRPFFDVFIFTKRTRKVKVIHILLIIGSRGRCILPFLTPTSSSITITTFLCVQVHAHIYILSICLAMQCYSVVSTNGNSCAKTIEPERERKRNNF
jgi:hypothetical protein